MPLASPIISRDPHAPLEGKKRILIVDDNASDTQLVKLCLEQTKDYVVREENDAEVALAAAAEFQPHLILLDVMMPVIDGCELAASLQASDNLKAVPIVIVTSLVTKTEVAARTGWLGRFPLLAKPFVISELVDIVKQHVGA